jgi:hypothetical protein
MQKQIIKAETLSPHCGGNSGFEAYQLKECLMIKKAKNEQ